MNAFQWKKNVFFLYKSEIAKCKTFVAELKSPSWENN